MYSFERLHYSIRDSYLVWDKKGKDILKMDMIHGPLVKNILRYAFPLMLSGILQLMFNAADVIVVGRFAGSQALAAVGSTGALCNMLINLFTISLSLLYFFSSTLFIVAIIATYSSSLHSCAIFMLYIT